MPVIETCRKCSWYDNDVTPNPTGNCHLEPPVKGEYRRVFADIDWCSGFSKGIAADTITSQEATQVLEHVTQVIAKTPEVKLNKQSLREIEEAAKPKKKK